jgi:hypothetical protein
VRGLAGCRRRSRAPADDLAPDRLAELADELLRTRDQALVLKPVAADEARWTEAGTARRLETFRTLAPLYRLRS